MSSESSKQGHMKRINPTIWTKSEFYSVFLSFIVRILFSDIRSGSSFRACFPSADVGVSSWSPLSSVDLFSAVYCSNWYGCKPYCLLPYFGSFFYLLQSRCFRKISAGDRLRSQMIHKWRNKPGNPKSNRKLHLLITGENLNISWPILRELGRVQSSGLKFGIIRGSSSILFNNYLKKKKKSHAS